VSFVPFQRIMALLMAAAMLFFVVPLAVQRKQYWLAVAVVAIFFAYLAFNAWLFLRVRRSRKP